MGTQVITRDTGRRLGVVGEVVVDIDRREVVALGLRDNPLTRFLPGLPRWMPLESIRQVGDVILVDSADSLSESFNPERYSKVINCQVVTESGAQLGRVLGFSFDIETGELTTLVIGALGVPLLGEGVLSTWELAVGEIVSSGSDRIIVYEGAEEKLKQLGTGLLEKLGIGGSGWEQEERERFRSGVVPAENQLPAGLPTASEQRRIQPATSRAMQPESELEYLELEDRRERQPLRQRRYLDDDLDGPDAGRRVPERDDDDRFDDGQRDFEGRDSRRPEPGRRQVESLERGPYEPEERQQAPFDRGGRQRERPELELPERGRGDFDGRDYEPQTGGRRRDEASTERPKPSHWSDQAADEERAALRPPAIAAGEERSRYRREFAEEDRRDWDEQPLSNSRREWAEERRPQRLDRAALTNSGPERGSAADLPQPARRPLAAEPRPLRGSGDGDPIDVEPEVLDDPW